MKAHWKYLKYVLKHKLFVYQEGRLLGVGRWQLLRHDLSKFLPSEWWPYVAYFYGPTPIDAHARQNAFDAAWLKHIHRNPHHHQYYVLREDSGVIKALEMPDEYLREMVADWAGAGRAIHGKCEVAEWYTRNADKMILHDTTRQRVERMILANYAHVQSRTDIRN